MLYERVGQVATITYHRPDVRNAINGELRDETGAEKIRWNFSEAWPSKWTGPALSAGTAAVAVESLEITHEELKKA